MRIPVIHGTIDRRILVNFRVRPDILSQHLPAPFRPKIVNGFGMVGVCLIRLRNIRPAFFPAWMGTTSENAAHRVAVEWDESGTSRSGVFVIRRDTNSRLNSLAGGRLFPGIHDLAKFSVSETASHFDIAVDSVDYEVSLSVRCHAAEQLPDASVFRSLSEASEFFQTGAIGYSPTRNPALLHGLELRCLTWSARPLAVESVHSRFFQNERRFPAGSLDFDSALLMRGIDHEWHGQPDLCCAASAWERAATDLTAPH